MYATQTLRKSTITHPSMIEIVCICSTSHFTSALDHVDISDNHTWFPLLGKPGKGEKKIKKKIFKAWKCLEFSWGRKKTEKWKLYIFAWLSSVHHPIWKGGIPLHCSFCLTCIFKFNYVFFLLCGLNWCLFPRKDVEMSETSWLSGSGNVVIVPTLSTPHRDRHSMIVTIIHNWPESVSVHVHINKMIEELIIEYDSQGKREIVNNRLVYVLISWSCSVVFWSITDWYNVLISWSCSVVFLSFVSYRHN